MISILFFTAAIAQDPSQLDQWVRTIANYGRSGPARTIDDESFLKRISSDLLGRDPTQEELEAFVASVRADKRSQKIDELLAIPGFANFWGARLVGMLIGDPNKMRLNAHVPEWYVETLYGSFTHWMSEQVQKDRSWNEIVRDLIEARGDPIGQPAAAYKVSFASQKDYPVVFGIGLARHFLGIRLDCARCHDHPYDRWTCEDLYRFAAFSVREGIAIRDQGAVFDRLEVERKVDGDMRLPTYRAADPKKANVRMAEGNLVKPNFLFGGEPGVEADWLKALAGLMTSTANRQLPRSFTNRVWGWLLGAGVIEPVDNFNLRNKPVSPALLESMTNGFIAQGYGLKGLVRAICLTEIYQRAQEEKRGGADKIAFWRNTLERPAFPSWRRPLGAKAPELPVVFDRPKEWVAISPRINVRFQFRVPGKNQPTPEADLGLIYLATSPNDNWSSFLDEWTRQIIELKTKTTSFEGKGAVTLNETAGLYTCNPEGDGPEPWLLLGARVKFPSGYCYVRFSGPPETVEAWRGEYLSLLKELRPK